MKYKRLVIDCSSLCYADAYSLKGLRTSEIETSVIFGFLNQILSLSERFKTNRFVFCWDSKGSKREELFPEYKLKRRQKKKDSTEDERAFYQSMIQQIIKLQQEIIPSIGFRNSFSVDGLEADDIMADIVIGYEDCVMVTDDEDLFQMLEYADLYKPRTEVLWTPEKFNKEYGIPVKQWVDVKSIGGCTSDEVPGIQGVRETTAIKWLLGTLKPTHKTYQAILAGKDIIERNRQLVKLPFPGTPEFELKKDEFSMGNLMKVADEYWIDSYKTKIGMQRWENFFNRGRICSLT